MSTLSAGTTVTTALVASGDTTGALTFQVNGTTTAATFDTSGNLGVGTTSPVSVAGYNILTLNGSTGGGWYLQNNGTSVGAASVNSGGMTFGTVNSTPTIFITSATERMRITSGGELLVGVTTATNNSRLKVQGSSTSSADYMVQFTNSSAQNAFYIKNDRTVFSDGVYNSTTASAANVFIDGAAQLLRSTSSLRYKHDVNDAAHGLADVLKLRSVTYKGINDGDKVFGGLIAEEVHDAGLTEFVAYDNEGRPDALHYGNMVALALKAIQELKTENDALKARIEALESK